MTNPLELTVHDQPWREAALVVDEGLGQANEQAAPLHEVQPLQCFVCTPGGEVVGARTGCDFSALNVLRRVE